MERTLEASMPTAARNQDPDVELIERYFAGIRAPLTKS